jgi:hypothetical protein
MEFIFSAFLGAIFGLGTCWIFWKYLFWLKPKVEIAPNISFIINKDTGKKVFRFKIINKGTRQITGIKFNAWVCDLMDIPNGIVSRGLHTFPIKNSDTQTLSTIKNAERPWGLSPETTIRSEPELDVLELLTDSNKKIMVTLRVADAISGTNIVIQKVYGKDQVKEGMFAFGDSFDILQA